MRSQFQASCLVVLMGLLSSAPAAAMPPAAAPGSAPPASNTAPIVVYEEPAAQPPQPTEQTQPVVYAAQPQPVQLQAPMMEDRTRFRFGIAAAFGGEFVEQLSAVMYGADLRLGVQINRLVGLYLQQHLSFGRLHDNYGNVGGLTGTYVAAAMVDFTLFNRLTVGGGFGYGVLNNPHGPTLAARVAYHPLASPAPYGGKRRSLMIGADLRTIFAGAGATGVVITVGIGYEAF